MATNKPVKITEEQLENAQGIWNGFAKLMKYGTIATVAILIVLGLTLISW